MAAIGVGLGAHRGQRGARADIPFSWVGKIAPFCKGHAQWPQATAPGGGDSDRRVDFDGRGLFCMASPNKLLAREHLKPMTD